LFNANVLFHLIDFKVDQRCRCIACRVIFCEDLASLIGSAIGYKPSELELDYYEQMSTVQVRYEPWGLWKPEEAYELKEWEGSLEDAWNAPGPGRVQPEGSVCRPGGKNGTEVLPICK
jgi:hypothetical protein